MFLLLNTLLWVRVISFAPKSVHQAPGRCISVTLNAKAGAKNRQNRISSLLDWSRGVEIQVKDIDLKSDPTSGLGWRAGETLGNDQVVLLVPSSEALTVSDSGPTEPQVFQMAKDSSQLRKLPWYCHFSLYLHYLKTNSLKTPWLESLPQQLDTVWHWSAAERAELQYTPLSDAVQRQEAQWKNLYNKVKEAGVTIEWIDFVWGCEIARSRAFSGSTPPAFNPAIYAFTLLLIIGYIALGLGTIEQAANGAGVVVSVSILNDFVVPKLFPSKAYSICPMIDMANHNTYPNANVSFEYFANSFSLATTLAIRKGEEVLISYGERSNDQLLQYYGFCMPSNRHDVYLLPPLSEWDIGAMEEATGRKVQSGRLGKLERAGLLGGRAVIDDDEDEGNQNSRGSVVITDDGVDPAILQALRALISTEEEWSDAGESVANFSQQLSPANEAAAKMAAKTIIQAELAGKPTTLDQDEKLLTTTSLTDASVAERLALEFRIAKKKLLKATLAKL